MNFNKKIPLKGHENRCLSPPRTLPLATSPARPPLPAGSSVGSWCLHTGHELCMCISSHGIAYDSLSLLPAPARLCQLVVVDDAARPSL